MTWRAAIVLVAGFGVLATNAHIVEPGTTLVSTQTTITTVPVSQEPQPQATATASTTTTVAAQTKGTTAPAPPRPKASEPGSRSQVLGEQPWGHTAPQVAVSIPPVMKRVRGCESGDGDRNAKRVHPGNYKAQNPKSTASGAWQFLDGTWRGARHNVPGAEKYARAMHAPPDIQDRVAMVVYEARGTQPWNASKGCWA